MKIPVTRFILLFFLPVFTINIAHAQPVIEWAKCYGGSGSDCAYAIDKGCGGGFVIAGTRDGCQQGANDFWVVKTDDSGNVIWTKCYGGSGGETAHSIQRVRGEGANDSGYIVVGITASGDGDVTWYQGGGDYWVVRTDVNGNLLWQKTLGGSMTDEGMSVRQTADGGYVVGGHTYSNDGDVTGNHGSADFWVVKLDGNGNVLWQKALGGSGIDYANSVDVTYDGGVIVAGQTSSTDGNVSNLIGLNDYWVVKLDAAGNLQWEKTYGSYGDDWALSVMQTTDTGYIIGGRSINYPGPGLYHGIIKVDKSGTVQWTAEPNSIVRQTADGGYVAINNTTKDYYVRKMDDSGSLSWDKTVGGSSIELVGGVLQADDGGCVIAGCSKSNDGDVSGNHGDNDFWIVKLASGVTGVPDMATGRSRVSVYPNPAGGAIRFSENVNARLVTPVGQVIIDRRSVNVLDIASAPAGVYFVILYDKDGRIIQKEKIIKE